MIQTIFTPEREDTVFAVQLPQDYVGRKVRVLFYIDAEIKNIPSIIKSDKKPSDFFGMFTKAEGEQFDKHIQQMRNDTTD